MVLRNIFRPKQDEGGDLGLELQPGDSHYRAYVGPPGDYDLVSAMVFNLLTCIGLRQHHRILDVGCGSLRSGRLLIPYLNPGNYWGVEPNAWLVQAGIDKEIGNDLVNIKKPTFLYADTLDGLNAPCGFDFAIAQSIFSHCGADLIERWLSQVSFHLKSTGALVATFLPASEDYPGQGWIYPGCVSYRVEKMTTLAQQAGLGFKVLDWAHPRQTWALFTKEHFDSSLTDNGPIAWNRVVERACKLA